MPMQMGIPRDVNKTPLSKTVPAVGMVAMKLPRERIGRKIIAVMSRRMPWSEIPGSRSLMMRSHTGIRNFLWRWRPYGINMFRCSMNVFMIANV